MLGKLEQEEAVQPSDRDRSWQVVGTVAFVFFSVLLAFSLHRYGVFYADSDHGIFTQVFWNNLHGRWFESSVSGTYSVSVFQDGNAPAVFYRRLAQHFTPALLLWLPVYALFPSPLTLIVLKTAIVAAAGIVLYPLSRVYLSPRIAVMLVLSFYCANTVIGPALGEFYDFCQLPLFFFTMMLALEKRWWWLFWIMAFLTLTIREDAGLIVFGTGIYLITSKRFPRVGLAVCSVSFLYMLLVTTVFMPMFTDEVSRRFMIEEFGQYTGDEEASTLDVIKSMIMRPWLILKELFYPFDKTLKYLTGHWLPLAFVPVLSWTAWLISGFPLVFNLLRDRYASLSINIRYTTPIVPGLFYGAILWWAVHQDRFKTAWVRRFWTICIALSLFFTITSNPHRAWSFVIPDAVKPWVHVSLPQQWHHAEQVRSILSQLPADASVSASRYLIAHIPQRRAVLRFPMLRYQDDDRRTKRVNYVAVDLWYPLTYEPAFRVSRNELREQTEAIDRLVERGSYRVIDFKDNIILMQRGGTLNSAALEAWNNFRQEIAPKLQKS